jgi:hypothetical protein
MAAMLRSPKGRWGTAVGGAVLIAALTLMLFRSPQPLPPEPATAATGRGVALVKEGDRTVADESVLLDPTPLFLPTKWNATPREVRAPEMGGRFQAFDKRIFTFQDNELKLKLPLPVEVPKSPMEAVADDVRSAALSGFGRTDRPLIPVEARGAFLEVVASATGRKVLTQPLAVTAPGKGNWRPMELMANVSAAGLVGPPVVTSSSGVEEVDAFFTNYLARTLRIGERLGPGFYRISIGP